MYALVLALVLGLPLIASADTINGCVKQSSGKLRIVGVPGQCKASETLVTWETEGGTQGPAGPAGPAGPQGPQGDPAPALPRLELVGFTTATFDGYEGVLGFTLACQVEFAGSRMCTGTEVAETINVPTGLTGQAWVRPDIRTAEGTGPVDSGSSLSQFSNALTCDGWKDGNAGLVVDNIGAFDIAACTDLNSAACCAPAP